MILRPFHGYFLKRNLRMMCSNPCHLYNFCFIFTLKATPMNEKLKFLFELKCEPFRQLGEGAYIEKSTLKWLFLSTSRLYPYNSYTKKPMYVIRVRMLIFRDRIRKKNVDFLPTIAVVAFSLIFIFRQKI